MVPSKTGDRPALPEVPADLEPSDAPGLTTDLLTHRERLTTELEQAQSRYSERLRQIQEEFDAETEAVASELSTVNEGLAHVGRVLSGLASEGNIRAVAHSATAGERIRTLAAPSVETASGLRDAIAAHLADSPRTWFSARDIAAMLEVPTNNRLTRAFNALVEEGRIRHNDVRGVGRKYRHKG